MIRAVSAARASGLEAIAVPVLPPARRAAGGARLAPPGLVQRDVGAGPGRGRGGSTRSPRGGRGRGRSWRCSQGSRAAPARDHAIRCARSALEGLRGPASILTASRAVSPFVSPRFTMTIGHAPPARPARAGGCRCSPRARSRRRAARRRRATRALASTNRSVGHELAEEHHVGLQHAAADGAVGHDELGDVADVRVAVRVQHAGRAAPTNHGFAASIRSAMLDAGEGLAAVRGRAPGPRSRAPRRRAAIPPARAARRRSA